jgi:SsrA-binding protein
MGDGFRGHDKILIQKKRHLKGVPPSAAKINERREKLMAAAKETDQGKTVAQNRKARFNYFIEADLETGMVLTGTEVKSLRQGRSSIEEAYAGEMAGQIYLFNAFIPEYGLAGAHLQHEPKRPRLLLMRRKERDKWLNAIRREGMTLIPLAIYFNKRGIAKLSLGLAKGKKNHDKRDAIKDRDWQRDKARLMRAKG